MNLFSDVIERGNALYVSAYSDKQRIKDLLARLEIKHVVRTPAGARRFKQPINSIIVAKVRVGTGHMVREQGLRADHELNQPHPKGGTRRAYYSKHVTKKRQATETDAAGHKKVRYYVELDTGDEERISKPVYDAIEIVEGPKETTPSAPRRIARPKATAAPQRPEKPAAPTPTPPRRVTAAKRPAKRVSPRAPTKRTAVKTAMIPATPEMLANMRTVRKEQFGEKIGAIPPAWTDVRINPNYRRERVDLLVTGIAGNGKKQYLYSGWHWDQANAQKFAREKKVAAAAKKLDRAIARDAATNDEAGAAMLMRHLGIRVGSSGSKQLGKVQSYGVLQLEAQHVKVVGNKTTFTFIGKHGQANTLYSEDPVVARVMRARLAQAQSKDEKLFNTTSNKTMAYLREKTGMPDIINHDLRTLLANELAAEKIAELTAPTTKTEFKRRRNEVGEYVASHLGNKPGEALKSYINDMQFDAWRNGEDW